MCGPTAPSLEVMRRMVGRLRERERTLDEVLRLQSLWSSVSLCLSPRDTLRMWRRSPSRIPVGQIRQMFRALSEVPSLAPKGSRNSTEQPISAN